MELGVILKRVGIALLAVFSYLQLEVSISHTWHIIIVCVSIFLGYVLGAANSSKTESKVNV